MQAPRGMAAGEGVLLVTKAQVRGSWAAVRAGSAGPQLREGRKGAAFKQVLGPAQAAPVPSEYQCVAQGNRVYVSGAIYWLREL